MPGDVLVEQAADQPLLGDGKRVMVVRMPSIAELTSDPVRRARFAATREAIARAIDEGFPSASSTDDEIVALVKRARRSPRAS